MTDRRAPVRRLFHRMTGGRLRGVRTLATAFLRLDLTEEMSFPLALVLTELGILVPLLPFFFISDLVGQSSVVGGDYFTFVAIGTAVSIMLNTAVSGFGGALQRSQNRGQFEYILAEPIPWLFLPFAMNTYRTLFGVFNGALVLVVAVVLGADLILAGIPSFVILMFLGLGASMGIGIVAACVMVVAKRSQPLLTLYSLAASLLGGALFSVDQLPEWLRVLSFAIPHTYVINAGRAALMADPGSFVIDVGTAALALGVFNLLVAGAGLWLFAKSLQYARREGLLGGY